MIPEFNEWGNLPPGIYIASWEEICTQFGSNEHRKVLLEGLRIASDTLRRAGCRNIYIDGSFVTKKRFPNDYDCVWDADGVDPNRLPRCLLEPSPSGREQQKFLYRGEFFPNNVIEGASHTPFLEFFQTDKETQERKGIIQLRLEVL